MTQNRSSAVMAQRLRRPVAPGEDPIVALHRALDFYPTPPHGTRAGAEIVRRLDPEAQFVWEPCCGEGHMAEPLKEYFAEVMSSDIHGHNGYGQKADFFQTMPTPTPEWIITNPPFFCAGEFIARALTIATRGVAVLARLQLLETKGRYPLLTGHAPLTLMAPFSERLPMLLGRYDPKTGTATAYAWFIWQKGAAPMPMLIIPPGTKKRLIRKEDDRFAVPLALFQEPI